MKICILSKYFPPASTEGIPRTRHIYAREFAKMGHEVHVVTSGLAGVVRIEDGLHIHEVADPPQSLMKYLQAFISDETTRIILAYSFSVYLLVRDLHEKFAFELIDSPSWDIEGYFCKLLLPDIPMNIGLATTSLQLEEINRAVAVDELSLLNKLERQFFSMTDGLVFDSRSILLEVAEKYHLSFFEKNYAVIHFGLPTDRAQPSGSGLTKSGNSSGFKLFSLGRLEKRKGTDLLVKKIIPALLKKSPDFEFHIAGKDCSGFDGFFAETGTDYRGYIKQILPDAIGKNVFFYGYVADSRLENLYRESDVVVCLSRYESFGLLFLEAMARARPVIAFAGAGAVQEIITSGSNGLLVSHEDGDAVVSALQELKGNPDKRKKLGEQAARTVRQKFSAEKMAKRMLSFYSNLILTGRQPRVIQVMDCLQEGDGVSNIVLNYQRLFEENGIDSLLLGRWATDEVAHKQTPMDEVAIRSSDRLLFQYWNHNDQAEYFNSLTARKAFIFQNLTNPHFFPPDHPHHLSTSAGFAQLKKMDGFDVYCAPSRYSLEILKLALGPDIKTFWLPPLIDREEVENRPFDELLFEQIREQDTYNILFVGRLVESKKQLELVDTIHLLRSDFQQKVHLYLVGDGDGGYVRKVRERLKKLELEKMVTLTGKVAEAGLMAYYRAVDSYLSLSEHEGFGLPLIEAAVFSVPVLAYRAGAVADTLAESIGLFSEKSPESVADLLTRVAKNSRFRNRLIRQQEKNLTRFSKENVLKRFSILFDMLDSGK